MGRVLETLTLMKRFILIVAAALCFATTLSAQTTYISPDLFIEELRGNVAKVEYLNEYGSVEIEKSYNEKGYIIPQEITIERDEQTRIIRITNANWGYTEEYTYDANGWLVKKSYEDSSETYTVSYLYDNTGTLARTIKSGENDDCEFIITTDYLIMGRDSNGNWFKRRRQITSTYDGETGGRETIIETRKITYR